MAQGEIAYYKQFLLGTVLALSILLSILPSVISIFRRTFHSKHASQPLQSWYDALARDPTRRLWNSGPPIFYFLFPDSGLFLDSASWDSGGILGE